MSSKSLKIKKDGFEAATNDLTAQQVGTSRLDLNGDYTALLKISLPIEGVKFEGNIVDTLFNTSEYWVYLTDGTKRFKILAPGYEPLEIVFSDLDSTVVKKDTGEYLNNGKLIGKTTYKLKIDTGDESLMFSKHNQIYGDVFFLAGQNMSAGLSIGAYFHAVNAELEFSKGLTKSEKLYWYDKNEMVDGSTYSSWSGNVKLGYGFQFKRRYQVTPQLGVGLLKCTSTANNPAKDANSVFGLLGCRGSFTFAEHLQVTIAPYYYFPLKKSSSFEEISNLLPAVDHWVNGFNVKIGISVFF